MPPAPARAAPTPDAGVPDRAVRGLQSDLAAIFDAPIMQHAQWSVLVRSLDSGDLLYQRQPGKLMMPASNMKIVTLAAAAHVLGWNARFVTTLETPDPIEGGVLRGDLYVRGGGDPTLNRHDGRGPAVFSAWATALTLQGVERIEGRIIGDDRLFDDERLGNGWSWDDLQHDYAAPIGALQWNGNSVELTVHPGLTAGMPGVVRLSADAGLTVLNRTVTTPAGVPETVEYRRRPAAPVLEVWGTVPLPAAADVRPELQRHVSHLVAVVDPTRFFAQAFKHALVDHGIGVSGDAVSIRDILPSYAGGEAARRVLARTESPPLREIASVLMKVSQNLYAETVLKAMGAGTTGLGTTAAGREAVMSVMEKWGIDPLSLVMVDGSGLSRYNYVSAEALTRILERLHADPRDREPFIASLPLAGREGTVSKRMRRSRAEGNAAAKTGSLSNVRALSGFVETRDGEKLVFSILANDFALPPATVTWIADLAVEVLANFTRQQ